MAWSVGGWDVLYNTWMSAHVPVGRGPALLFFCTAVCLFSPFYRPSLAYFGSTTSVYSSAWLLSSFSTTLLHSAMGGNHEDARAKFPRLVTSTHRFCYYCT